MEPDLYYYRCSMEYVESICPTLQSDLTLIMNSIPKRNTQAEVNRNLFWLLTSKQWSFDSLPVNIKDSPPEDLRLKNFTLNQAKDQNDRSHCRTSSTIEARWHVDFSKVYNGNLVQIEAQFGKVESMFKDFCGFQIAFFERRLSLGVEIVFSDPHKYFSHRRQAISGMAYFNVAQLTLPAIGVSCPILLIGIKN